LLAEPYESWPPILLKIHPLRLSKLGESSLPFECTMNVHTFSANYRIPLVLYDGRFTVVVNGVNATTVCGVASDTFFVLRGEMPFSTTANIIRWTSGGIA